MTSISYKPKVHYRFQHSPPPINTHSQTNPIHTTPSSSFKITLIPSSYLCLCLQRDLASIGLPHQNPVWTFPFPRRVTRPDYLIIFNSIIRVILLEKYRSWSCPVCSLLQSAVASSHLVRISFSASYIRMPAARVPHSMWETKLQTHIKEQAKF